MEFIKLESRGGNYLVVAQNIAWLRTAENGQTNVGIVGGQPLLVVGSIEEVAEKILSATAAARAEQPAAEPVALPAVPSAVIPEAAPTVAPAAVALAPEPEPEPVADTAPPAPDPVVETAAKAPPKTPAPERLRANSRFSSTLADRLARAGAPTVKAGSQRLMTMSE